MKRLITILLSLTLGTIFAAGFDPSPEIENLKASGQTIAFGKSEQTGNFIICKETVIIKDGNVALAQETAKMQARATIAEFMSAKVSVSTNRTQSTKSIVSNTQKSFEMNKFAEKCMSKSAEQVQKGISVCAAEQHDGKLTVYCVLMENIVDASAQMEAAMKKLGPNTVQVTGFCCITNTISEAQAEKNAIQEAQREAIAQVLGVSTISQSYRQTISHSSRQGKESSFECDDSFKAKVFSSAAGFVESSRVIDKKVDSTGITVTIVATVAKDKLISDYRSYLESMGNPGFCVRSNDREMLDLYAGFFGSLGCRMVDNLYDAAYVIDVHCKFIQAGNGIHAAIRVVAKDKTNETTLFALENDPSEFTASSDSALDKTDLCRRVLNSMRPKLHKELNTFIGRANADGRKIQVKFNRCRSRHKSALKTIGNAMKMIPGASNVKQSASGNSVVFTLNYKGETEDLADFLEKQIETDISSEMNRPKRGKIGNTNVEFNFK